MDKLLYLSLIFIYIFKNSPKFLILLNENHELKKEIIDINNNINIKEKIEIEDENKIIKYIPYIIGGSIILFLGGRYIYKKLKNN